MEGDLLKDNGLAMTEKQKRDFYVNQVVEYKNPHMQKRTKKLNFPDMTEEEKERLKNCDIYGNPRKSSND